jgi:hypothetical protein
MVGKKRGVLNVEILRSVFGTPVVISPTATGEYFDDFLAFYVRSLNIRKN